MKHESIVKKPHLSNIKSLNNPLHFVTIRLYQPHEITIMTVIKRVALIGAGGKLGPSIFDAFLVNGNFDVTVLSRISSAATFPPEVKTIKKDFDYDSLRTVFSDQDAVVSIVEGRASQRPEAIHRCCYSCWHEVNHSIRF